MMTKSKYGFIISLMALLFFSGVSLTDQDIANNVIKKVAESIQKGDSQELSKYFFDSVEVEIMGEDNFYSRSQAEQLLGSFFKRNRPLTFTVNHKGVKEATAFAIGLLQTEKDRFRVSLLLKIQDGKALIHQIRIESDDENV